MRKKTSINKITDLSLIGNGDCLALMKMLSDASVDLILTDPPYNLGLFMKKEELISKGCVTTTLPMQDGMI